MCGIAGIVVSKPGALDLRSVVEQMQSRLTHRGPDDRGLVALDNDRCVLAHTRLSILDLSPAGHQPMSTPDERYWITYNGEIYNYRELREELGRRREALGVRREEQQAKDRGQTSEIEDQRSDVRNQRLQRNQTPANAKRERRGAPILIPKSSCAPTLSGD